MNYWNKVEKTLKSCLKRKVKMTMGVMVAFLITGQVGICADFITKDALVKVDGEEKTITEENYKIVTGDKEETEVKSGILVTNNGKLEIKNNSSITVNYNLSNTTDDTGWRRLGIESQNGGSLILNSPTIDITSKTDKDIAVGIHAWNPSGEKGGTIDITTDKLNVTTESSDYFTYGIYVYNGTTNETNDKNKSRVTINSKDTVINSTALDPTKGQSNGIIAWSQGIVEIDGGNITIKADNVINTRGNSKVSLNASDNINHTVKLDGDIVFEYNKDSSGTTVDSNVDINLSNKDSYFNGNIVVTGEPPADKSKIDGVNLKISNGAKWATKSEGNNSIFSAGFVLKGGTFENNIETVVYAKNGIQMQGSSSGYNSVLTGNGSLTTKVEGSTFDSGAVLLSVSGVGNEISLGKDATLSGVVEVSSGAELKNTGTFKLIDGSLNNAGKITLANNSTIELGEGITFVNEQTGEIVVESGSTAITGNKVTNNAVADENRVTNNGLITLKDTKFDDGTATVSKLVDGVNLKNNGTIALADVSGTMSETQLNEILKNLITNKGEVKNYGMYVNKDGKAILSSGIVIEDGATVDEIVNKVEGATETGNNAIKIEDKANGEATTIKGSTESSIKNITVNVEGNLSLAADDNSTNTNGVKLENTVVNVSTGKNITAQGSGHKIDGTVTLNGSSKIVVGETGESGELTLSGTVAQGQLGDDNGGAEIDITNGTLKLDGANIEVKISSEDSNSSLETTGTNIITGDIAVTTINTTSGVTTVGKSLNFGTLNIGSLNTISEEKAQVVLKADTKLTGKEEDSDSGKIMIGDDGQLVVEVATNGDNALKSKEDSNINIGISKSQNSNFVRAGEEATNNVDVLFRGEFTGKEVTVDTNATFTEGIGVGLDSDFYTTIITDNDNGSFTFEYKLNSLGNTKLDSLNNLAYGAGRYLSGDAEVRKAEIDKLYSSSIYSETIKATYDNLKLNERNILGVDIPTEVGKWTAQGIGIYNKASYDVDGELGRYGATTESSGLMGMMEYGVDNQTSVGVALSGVKENISSDSGKSDGTALYLGTYAKKNIGSYSLMAGLGYQFTKYDTDNKVAEKTSSDKYNSNAISTYVQGKYSVDLGDNLAFEPKVRMGYTYAKQDSTMDDYFGIKSADISIFEGEIGADFVKTLALKKGRLELVFGAGYVRTMGDTDKKVEARMVGADETTDVLGAKLTENTGKFNFDIRVSKDNGLFYNGGVNLNIGDDNTRDYGVNLGVGYRF